MSTTTQTVTSTRSSTLPSTPAVSPQTASQTRSSTSTPTFGVSSSPALAVSATPSVHVIFNPPPFNAKVAICAQCELEYIREVNPCPLCGGTVKTGDEMVRIKRKREEDNHKNKLQRISKNVHDELKLLVDDTITSEKYKLAADERKKHIDSYIAELAPFPAFRNSQ